MDNEKIKLGKTSYGNGLFARALIKKGELIASFDGKVYGWYSKFWSQDLYDHCIQFEERKWRDSEGLARFINHSCNPNCGIKNRFDVVAMRDISPGEQLFWDYEMTEDHPFWRMECRCGNQDCRAIIGTFQNMPPKKIREYKGYISEWLVKKYKVI